MARGQTNSGAVWYDDGTLVTNGFDVLGCRVNKFTVVENRLNVVASQVDPVGNVTNAAVSNTALRYGWTYDAAERPSLLTAQAASDRMTTFQWNYDTNNGQVASVTNAAISELLGSDVLDRATNIACKTAAGTTVRSFGYAFSAAGMITNVLREDGAQTAYTYDSLDRLTSERSYGPGGGLSNSASWTYDLAGNRTMAVTNGVTNLYSYAAGNQLTNFGAGTLVQYDPAGNTTNIQYSASRRLGLKWDGAYQLTEVRTNGVLVETYRYDALGRRVSIAAGAVTNSFVYDGPHIIAEYSNNVLARSYAYGPAIDDVLSMTTYGATTSTLFYLKDHLGSVHALVSTNGAVVEQYKYTAWGETTVLSSNGTVLAASAYGNRVTWQGREISWKTGLLFFRSRYYAPSVGRWLSKDRLGIAGGGNLYEAFNDNPINYRDPLGRCSEPGGVFADRYWNSLMRNPFSPYNVIARHLRNPAIDIGQTRRGTMFPYMGGPMSPDVLGNVVAGETLTGAYGAGIASFLFVVAEGANVLDGVARARGQLLQDATGSFRANYTGMGRAWAEHPVHTTALTIGTFTPLMPVALVVNWVADRLGQWSGGGGLNLSW